MAVANMSELPDLDSLLNGGENQSCLIRSLEENETFDPTEFAGVVKFYHEKSKSFQLHYDQYLENQKRKLAKENEDSFLKDVQQSLQNYESDHVMSDFANLSSTLGRDGEFDKPCRLKEILLSPFSDRYSREVNSPEHMNKGIVEFGNSSPCPPGQQELKSRKAMVAKRLNQFAELRKHMEATTVGGRRENAQQSATKLGRTKMVSTKQYISKYGSATAINDSQVAMPAEEVERATKRVLIHPVAVARKGENRRHTLTLALKSSTAAKILDGKSKVLIQNTCSSGTGTMTGVTASIVTTRPNGGVCAAVKRSHSSSDQVPPKKVCLITNSGDHDYCTEPSVSNPIENQRAAYTVADDLSTAEKPNHKVVKWHDYLRQRREGVRSAPNSPSSSPSVAKGSVIQSNNFMVVSLHNGHMPAKVLVNSVARMDKSQSEVPLPLPLKKNTVKTQFELQEFNKYIMDLKDNLKSPKVTPVGPENENQAYNAPSGKPISASQSLAAIAQQHMRKSEENCKADDNKNVHRLLSQSNSDGSSNPNSRSTDTSKNSHVAGRSGQFLMIKVPIPSSGKTLSSSSSVASSSVLSATDTTKTPESNIENPNIINNHETVNEQLASSKTPSKGGSATVTASSVSPTFDLKPSNKDSGKEQSFVLSGMGRMLKDVLVELAERQAKLTAEGNYNGIDKEDQQIKILQSIISSMKSDKPGAQTSNLIKSVEVVTASDSSDHSLMNGLDSLHPSEIGGEQPCSIISESRMDQPTVTNGLNNVTCVIPITSQADNCNALPVQYNQSLDPNLTNEETLVDITKADAKCSIVGNTVSNDMTNDILASAVSNVHTGKRPALNGNDLPVRVEGMDILLVSNSGVNELGESVSDLPANANGPAVITLEEAMMELADDDMDHDRMSQSGSVSFPKDENFFCKLPSYYMNGKVMKEEPPKDMEVSKNEGTEQESSDPSVSEKPDYNKLPHYFSSGKPSRDHSMPADEAASKNRDKTKGSAVKLNPVSDGHHLTAQGAPVDTSETYYSRLPSYYSYGRPHPPVKTFNDEAADAKDDTVTPQTLESSDSRHERRKKKKKLKKRKKKKKSKHDDNTSVDEVSEKITYCKVPYYYLSSKVVKHPENNSRMHSPTRSSGTRSSSSYSHSYHSRSSRSRSRSSSSSSSRERYRSRSYSRSPVSSDSDSGSQRSWRQERPSMSSRSGRGMDRRGCRSTDRDSEDYRWHREREVRKSRRQHRAKQEKDNEQAMKQRRVVYIGGIEDKITKQELRKKFLKFGNIESVNIFFRDDRDNYGFLTFKNPCDAFSAIDQGADLAPPGSRYDLCFGGRRQFCKSRYEDLDGRAARAETEDADDFDALLQRAKRGLRH